MVHRSLELIVYSRKRGTIDNFLSFFWCRKSLFSKMDTVYWWTLFTQSDSKKWYKKTNNFLLLLLIKSYLDNRDDAGKKKVTGSEYGWNDGYEYLIHCMLISPSYKGNVAHVVDLIWFMHKNRHQTSTHAKEGEKKLFYNWARVDVGSLAHRYLCC